MAFEVLEQSLPAQAAAGATTATVVGAVPSAFSQPSYNAARLSVTSPSLVTGQATNFATINVRQLRAGTPVATIGTLALSAATVTLAAEVETVIPVTGTPVLLAGDVLDVQLVQTGTGLTLPAGIVAKIELS